MSSIFDNNYMTGQSQSGLWFGKTDDLWTFGKPQGWGGVWRRDNITAGEPSDPYLLTGFDKKVKTKIIIFYTYNLKFHLSICEFARVNEYRLT